LEHRQTVVGLFGEPEQARDAITALKDAGLFGRGHQPADATW
jgi:hypothetical protein